MKNRKFGLLVLIVYTSGVLGGIFNQADVENEIMKSVLDNLTEKERIVDCHFKAPNDPSRPDKLKYDRIQDFKLNCEKKKGENVVLEEPNPETKKEGCQEEVLWLTFTYRTLELTIQLGCTFGDERLKKSFGEFLKEVAQLLVFSMNNMIRKY
jgi:hypothetical protein